MSRNPSATPSPTPELSIVVPVYDEAESLPTLVDEVAAALAGGPSWELLLVDDGSRDDSPAVMARLRAAWPGRVRILRSPVNQGQSSALGAGFRAARAPIVATLDADLQNDPADIPRLLAALDTSPGAPWDMVSGIRAERRDRWQRRVASRVANRVRNAVVGDSVSDVGCSLKVYRRRFLVGLPVFDGLHRFLPALLEVQGARITEIDVRHRPRLHGHSKYTISDRLWRGIYDLFGVRWLRHRFVDLSRVEEVPVLARGPEVAPRPETDPDLETNRDPGPTPARPSGEDAPSIRSS